MKTRTIDKAKDLPTIEQWYKDHGWDDKLIGDIFPSRGFMVEGLAAIWLYVADDLSAGWVAHMVINPKKNRAVAMKALHMLYERAEREGAQLGLRLITQAVHHASLKKLAKQHNYLQGDENLTSYWKAV